MKNLSIIPILLILLMGCRNEEFGKESSKEIIEKAYSEEYRKCIVLNDSALMIQMDNHHLLGKSNDLSDSIYRICSTLYNEAIQCDSNLFSAWSNKAVLLAESEKIEEGIKHLNSMKKQFPDTKFVNEQLKVFLNKRVATIDSIEMGNAKKVH